MKLKSGIDVEVVGEQIIDNKKYLICKLPHTLFMYGAVMRFVMLRPNEFVEYLEQVHKESEDLTDLSKVDIVVETSEEVKENVVMDSGEISQADIEQTREV